MPEPNLTAQKPKRPDLTTAEKIAKAEARIKKLRKANKATAHKIDTRKKVIAGAALFRAFDIDSDLKAMVLPTLKESINGQDFAFAFGEIK